MRVRLHHGTYTLGDGSVDYIGSRLATMGLRVDDVAVPRYSCFGVGFPPIRRKLVETIVDNHKPGDIWLSHSGGSYLEYLAMKDYGCEPSLVVWLSPAIRSNISLEFCRFEHLHVYSNCLDKVIFLASLLPGHPYGAMGRRGYTGLDERIENHRYMIDDETWLDHCPWTVDGPLNAIVKLIHNHYLSGGMRDCSAFLP